MQAYLRLNGFFTVTEHPVLAWSPKGVSSLTDIDVLAVRFPRVQQWITGDGVPGRELARDSALEIGQDQLQLIIGEVKEGRSKLNRSAFRPRVLEAVIRRFGCCEDHPRELARRLLEEGSADTRVSDIPCRVRMMVFGGTNGDPRHRYETMPLRHIVEFMNGYVHRYPEVFFSTAIKDDGFCMMALLAKLGVEISADAQPDVKP